MRHSPRVSGTPGDTPASLPDGEERQRLVEDFLDAVRDEMERVLTEALRAEIGSWIEQGKQARKTAPANARHSS